MRVQVACTLLLATGTTLISAAATTPTGDAAPVLVALHHHQQQLQQEQQQQQHPLVDPSVRAHHKSHNANQDQDQDRLQQDDGWMAPVVEAGAQAGQSMGAVVLFVVGAAGVFAMGLV